MLARILILVIKLYQRTVSRMLPRACRFDPSCSRYAVACLEAHGPLRGSLLSIVRLCKCHPFHPGGYDPPPPRGLLPRVRTPERSEGSDAYYERVRTPERSEGSDAYYERVRMPERSEGSDAKRDPWIATR
jgi:putative membrane protein insertion efficiency factor